MPTRLNPYLNFKDNAREAMEFYRSVFGGTLTVSTFKEFQASHDPSDDNKVMHSQLDAGDGLVLMGADTPTHMDLTPGNTNISLSGEDEAQLRRYWNGLAAGATVTVPLEQAPWGDTFGMLTDKFGVQWMVNIAGPRG
jgi:PhnB protein